MSLYAQKEHKSIMFVLMNFKYKTNFTQKIMIVLLPTQ